MRNSSSGNLRKTKYEVGGRWSFVTNDGKKWQYKETLGLSFFALLKRKTHHRP